MTRADQIILRCVTACAQARDGRGRWRVEAKACADLQSDGSTHTIAAMTARAAARVGAWISDRADAIGRGVA